MKKLLIKILKALLRKLVKPTHYQYKMADKELQRVNLENYVLGLHRRTIADVECCHDQKPETKEQPVEEIKAPSLYIYNESLFSIGMKNIPPKLIQSYWLYDKSIELQIILGGEDGFDVYDELNKKIQKGIELEEDIVIEIYSYPKHNRRITLKNIKISELKAFNYCSTDSKNICKSHVTIQFNSKDVELF